MLACGQVSCVSHEEHLYGIANVATFVECYKSCKTAYVVRNYYIGFGKKNY